MGFQAKIYNSPVDFLFDVASVVYLINNEI